MNKIKEKILIISFGSIGKRHLTNSRKLMPNAEIAVFKTTLKKNIKKPKNADFIFYDFKAVKLFKPNLVIITSPASEHLRYAKMCLKLGAHLFIEKPISTSTSGINEIIDIAEKSNLFVCVGYMFRFHPIINLLQKVVTQQKYGKLYTMNIDTGQYLPDWRPETNYREGVSAKKDLGGGVLFELSHEIDYATLIVGHPSSVFCSVSKISDLEIDSEDCANIIFEYNISNKRMYKITINIDFLQRVASRTIKIIFSEGTVLADLIKQEVTVYSKNNPEGEKLFFDPLVETNDLYLKQFDFLFCKTLINYNPIFSETKTIKFYSDSYSSKKVVELIDACNKSNKDGKKIIFN